jgi:hypothetical protein
MVIVPLTRSCWFAAGCLLALATLGCGGSSGEFAPVHGILTIGGKPIDRAEIVLRVSNPAAGPQAVTRAVTDKEGHFVFKSITPEKKFVEGAVVGKHQVFVSTRIVEQDANGNERVVRKELLSPKYTSGEELSIDIPPEGIEELKFDLPAG